MAESDRIAVFVNPHSRANRKNPRLGAEFQAIVGGSGRVLAARDLAELDAMAVALRANPPEVIAIHGGDGTLHRTLSALGAVWGERPLPPLALLAGGTMNVVASSLRIVERPTVLLKRVVEVVEGGQALDTMRRRCLRVGTQLGFVFGNGLLPNFLGEYYATGSYGPRRALWLIVRICLSALVHGPFVRRVFRRFEGRVSIDGQPLERTRFVGVTAATVQEVGLGFKLIHRADDDPERFGVLAIHAPPLALLVDLRAVHAGRGVATSRALSAVASTMDLEGSEGGEMSYTIDGDLYRTLGPLRITIGPAISFVRPPAQLIARTLGDTIGAGR